MQIGGGYPYLRVRMVVYLLDYFIDFFKIRPLVWLMSKNSPSYLKMQIQFLSVFGGCLPVLGVCMYVCTF